MYRNEIATKLDKLKTNLLKEQQLRIKDLEKENSQLDAYLETAHKINHDLDKALTNTKQALKKEQTKREKLFKNIRQRFKEIIEFSVDVDMVDFSFNVILDVLEKELFLC